jgi:hypothetical protein
MGAVAGFPEGSAVSSPADEEVGSIGAQLETSSAPKPSIARRRRVAHMVVFPIERYWVGMPPPAPVSAD